MACGPRLNGEATKKLQNQYVLMRQGVAEQERSSGKKGAVPITVRQLEAIIRISGKIKKKKILKDIFFLIFSKFKFEFKFNFFSIPIQNYFF